MIPALTGASIVIKRESLAVQPNPVTTYFTYVLPESKPANKALDGPSDCAPNIFPFTANQFPPGVPDVKAVMLVPIHIELLSALLVVSTDAIGAVITVTVVSLESLIKAQTPVPFTV